MANANVVLKISSDVGNAITGLKSFIDLAGMAVGVVVEFAKENDKFANAMRRSTIDITKADAATSGLIETTELFLQQQKLANANLHLTEEQYRAVAVAAAEQGKITGDATGEFKKLTEALTKGSAEAFRALGMDIKMTNGLMSAQGEMLDALVKKYGKTTVEVETFSEGVFALGNNLSTTTGLLWANITAVSGLDKAINPLNKMMSDMNNLLMKGIGFWDIMNLEVGRTKASLAMMLSPIADVEQALRSLFNMKGMGFIRQFQADKAIEATLARRVIGQKNAAWDDKKKKQEAAAKAAGEYGAWSSNLDSLLNPKGGKSKGRSGGGGGRRNKQDSFDMDFEAIFAEEEALMGRGSNYSEFGSDQSMYAEPENMMSSTMMATGKTEFQIQDEEAHAEAIKLRAEAEKTAHDSRMKYLTEYGEAADKEQRAYADRWNMNTEHGKTWAETWTNSIDTIDAKAAILQTSFGGFQKIVTNMVSTLMKGDRMTVKAMANMVKGVTQQIAVEAQVRAIMSLAMAAFEAASSWGASPRIAQFLAAAGQFQATAIVALAVSSGAGAVAGRRGSGSRRPTGVMPQTSADMSPSMGNQGDRMVNVNVFLEGDADSLFRVVSDKNQEKKMAGESGI